MPTLALLWYFAGVLGCWALFHLLLKKARDIWIISLLWPFTFPAFGVIAVVAFVARVMKG
jgi:hypothetical protein